MNNRQLKYNIKLLTPSFCKIGENKPEIRAASIRGMVREWKRLTGSNPERIWGGRGGASKIGIDILSVSAQDEKAALLPHKDKGGAYQSAVISGSCFEMAVNRLVGCAAADWKEAKQDIERWIVLGCLGQRANRAAGSVWCDDLKINCEAVLKDFLAGISGEVYISGIFNDPAEARVTASDTVSNEKYFGSFNPRKPSPIKMKIIEFAEENYRILFFSKEKGLTRKGFDLLQCKHDNRRWRDVELTKII